MNTDGIKRPVEISIIKNNDRVFAAQFKVDTLQGIGAPWASWMAWSRWLDSPTKAMARMVGMFSQRLARLLRPGR